MDARKILGAAIAAAAVAAAGELAEEVMTKKRPKK